MKRLTGNYQQTNRVWGLIYKSVTPWAKGQYDASEKATEIYLELQNILVERKSPVKESRPNAPR